MTPTHPVVCGICGEECMDWHYLAQHMGTAHGLTDWPNTIQPHAECPCGWCASNTSWHACFVALREHLCEHNLTGRENWERHMVMAALEKM